MSWAALAGGAISAIGSVLSADKAASSQSKAIDAQQKAAQESQIDINKLDEQTRSLARQNAFDSAALERQLTPEVPQLRADANNSVVSALNNGQTAGLYNNVAGSLGQHYNTPLLQQAIAKASANLALGGKLGVDQQNLVTRNAIANAGSVAQGQGGSGLGRDLTARDLGLSSLDLENQRLAQASALAPQELNAQQADSTNYLNRISALSQLNQQGYGQALGAAQYGQSIKQPTTGLDPSAAANVAIANANNRAGAASNQANIYGQQGNQYLQFAGNLGANALTNFNQYATAYKGVGNTSTTPQNYAVTMGGWSGG